MREFDVDFELGGGSRYEGVVVFFQGGDPGGVVVWGGEFSSQGCARAHQEAAEDTGGWELGILLIGGVNGGHRLQGDHDKCHEKAEYGCVVYCDANNSGPL